ncbi:MAG: NAD-dependent epimerase/dehydratase family protein, partial [Pirellulaceae bacterium]
RCWRAAGHDTFAVTRSSTKARELEAEGIRPLVFDITESVELPAEQPFETVLFAVGFDRSPKMAIYDVFVGALRRILDSLGSVTARLIHISSTGVYGQRDDEWVDEDSPCNPRRKGGLACLAAERTLVAHPLSHRSIILRLAGIYGPHRIPRLRDLRAGKPVAVPRDGYLNLIHVNDVVRVILAAERRAKPPCVYAVADGRPVMRRDFYAEAARLLNAPIPRFENPDPASASAQRAISSKRIRNARMMHDLALTLQYPCYKEGLAAIAARESSSHEPGLVT